MLMGTSSKISFYMSHIWMNVIWHTMWKAWIIEWGCEDHSHRITPSTLFTSLPMLIPSVFYSLFLKFPPVQLSVLLILCTQLPYKIYIHSSFTFLYDLLHSSFTLLMPSFFQFSHSMAHFFQVFSSTVGIPHHTSLSSSSTMVSPSSSPLSPPNNFLWDSQQYSTESLKNIF